MIFARRLGLQGVFVLLNNPPLEIPGEQAVCAPTLSLRYQQNIQPVAP
jgi:hypothetical protein